MRTMTRRAGHSAAAAISGLVLSLQAPHQAAAAVTCVAGMNGAMICPVDTATFPDAKCNQTTTPTATGPEFWFRKGSGTGTANWVIWLEGGGQCTDQPSCNARPDNLTSSNGFTDNNQHGALSSSQTVNPLLYNANTVLVHYCSSDLWSGGVSAPIGTTFKQGDPSTWNFQGRGIALAAIGTIKELNLGLANAKTILLGGSSAGGAGITLTANDIIPKLPTSATILLANDAGFTLDVGQYDATNPPNYFYPGPMENAYEMTIENGIGLWHGKGDSVCLSNGGDPVTCYNTALVLQSGVIHAPSFVDEAQMDKAQLQDELCPLQYGDCGPPTGPMQTAYANYFASQMVKLLIGAGTPAAYFAYSPDDYLHTMLDGDAQFQTKYIFPGTMHIAPRDAFDAWLMNPTQPRVVLIGNAPNKMRRR